MLTQQDITEKEDTRRLRRLGSLESLGMDSSEAERLSYILVQRDRDREWDTRHLCIECSHLKENLTCIPGQTPIQFVLQRCDGFKKRIV